MTTPSQLSSESVVKTIVRLLRWDKPAGRLILMIPALWGIVLAARGLPPIPLIFVIICGSLATSGLGCVVNDLWDRDIDPKVARTRDRPLASRALSIKTGIGVGLVALASAAGLAFYLNPLSFLLCLAAVPIILCYPLAKRFFPIPQLVLALAWGFAVLISWSAVTGTLETPTLLLWGAVVLWTLGFDTVYAMSDRDDDAKIGVNSSALFFGSFAPLFVGLCFLGTAGLLADLALILHLQTGFWLTWLVAIVGWMWQYLQLLRDNLSQSIYGLIFRQNVVLGFILLLGMIMSF
ncbi:4-hydroxybenzoate solanesyltransferase [Spirulina sp. 06S082]|uniref:4-hydroxybenzoate solanesyltransferase n=1 Tax=Spirulina sp. 06S082 TaxID=3110248 RepID=UPI002B21703D|nr:4-hydroxybenzoate solanesyltransferase [Spirulina sp. 06S082]MEA5472458.1 4-hydroxybenzoate solanesyltransferase [Spirulina sp. 06S082]